MANNLQRATFIGLLAIILWSTSVGLIRSITETFGPLGGGALLYSATALLLCFTRGLPRLRTAPKGWLLSAGLLFVSYEIALATALGLAASRQQALELGMINYLWPSLTIVLAIALNGQRWRFWLWPGLLLALAGIIRVLGGDNGFSLTALKDNIHQQPLAYGLAGYAALAWALYNNITRRFARGHNGVTLFFLVTALALWAGVICSPQPLKLSWQPGAWLEVLIMAAFVAAAYSCWDWGIQHGNLSLLAAASYFTPVLSSLLAAIWLGITPAFAFWQGVAMVTLGSLLCWRGTR
ncbi:EamA family transporter [Izhakiella australiensis]|uniref:EamA family transporter n=1 Tax=Izhakiella australiensis TaxID=1926881 RepID=A0A1S8YQD5_9GAMM|nr:aromatic amino acid DMT transporter YddG [Izhakiella australiensis]OON41274.1 EamA family transporter [Izhakiella australiensis]